jgi:polysaccharide deacetylase 2 family uncharacterized protein YibQ
MDKPGQRGFGPRHRFAWILLGLLACSSLSAEPAKIAIIIDDLGYRADMDRVALALDARVAVAIIPDAPGAFSAAESANARNREVLIHLPLSHLQGDCEGVTCPHLHWSVEQMAAHLKWANQRVPGAVGVSNHQGSLFTADPGASRRLVEGLLRLNSDDGRSRFVIDSRTSASSQLAAAAHEAGLAYAERQVFLDHEPGLDALEEAWTRLLDHAERNGQALAIGHPHPETLSFLKARIPLLSPQHVTLVPVSRLLSGVASRQTALSSGQQALER